ncbi:hypothetical protein H5410_031881 [Solanum commersonii]|uniref:Uncharacterized protein n=1 Tax=Solanum commersonii TaxID=4109 RepID=A0A9J5YL93_SOLCO|nr:hypothetical protein H5410_031881 [Solanum commersonii]
MRSMLYSGRSKDLSAQSRPMDRKKDAGKENERRNPNLLWECEIGRREKLLLYLGHNTEWF